jgi:hydroxyacylglutathione hydrolase
MYVRSMRTPGLGDATYLLAHDGVGLLVDPQRDIDRFLAAAEEVGVGIRWVLETHVHNDYLSGAPAAARATGAELVLPAAAGAAYPHTPAYHGEDLVSGPLAIRPLHTPGHTPEHTSYLVLIDWEPVAVFTGGSLLVGAAGRTDLLGAERALQLARLQYDSLQRLAALPDQVAVLPTHGTGSFCVSGATSPDTASTVRRERASNPALSWPDAEAFAAAQLQVGRPYPAYYRHMAPANLAGAPPMPPAPAAAPPPHPAHAAATLASFFDIRPRRAAARTHPAGSLPIEQGDSLATWVGWLVPHGAPLVLVAEPWQDIPAAVTGLARIGFDDVVGVLLDVDGWAEAGYPVSSYPVVSVEGFVEALRRGEAEQILDVRSPQEWEEERLDGACHCYLPDLVTEHPTGLRDTEPVWVVCASGARAATAAGLLEQAGRLPVLVDGGGVADALRLLTRQPTAPA